jgi:hypothetical protein
MAYLVSLDAASKKMKSRVQHKHGTYEIYLLLEDLLSDTCTDVGLSMPMTLVPV